MYSIPNENMVVQRKIIGTWLKKSEREQGCFSLKIAGPNPNFT
jgi:hypothetical protein